MHPRLSSNVVCVILVVMFCLLQVSPGGIKRAKSGVATINLTAPGMKSVLNTHAKHSYQPTCSCCHACTTRLCIVCAPPLRRDFRMGDLPGFARQVACRTPALYVLPTTPVALSRALWCPPLV